MTCRDVSLFNTRMATHEGRSPERQVNDMAARKTTTRKAATGKQALPAAIAAAVKTNVSANVARAIATELGISIAPKTFRDTVRRRLGYTSGKHGDKYVWDDTGARTMLDHYAARSTSDDK